MIGDTISVRNIGKFRYFCQKILPAVYDDSLSYYELLNKIVWYLNTVIDEVNVHSDAIKELQEELQNFIDGNFDDIIEEKVDEWFEENEPSIMATIEELTNEIDKIVIDNEYFNSSQDFNGSIISYDGKPYLNLSTQPLNLGNFHNVPIQEIFEDYNHITLTNSEISWDTGDGVLTNAQIQNINSFPTLMFSSNSESPSTLELPNFNFQQNHVYVCFGQYQIPHYEQGFIGIRSINRFSFSPFASNEFKSFLYVIVQPGNETNSYYQDDAILQTTSQVLLAGVFYDSSITAIPDASCNIRMLGLIDLYEIFGNTQISIEELSNAFNEYINYKLANTSVNLQIPIENINEYKPNENVSNFIQMMKYRAYGLSVPDAKWYTASGFSLNQSVSSADYLNYGTVKDLLKFGIAAMSNNIIQTILSMGNCFIGSFGHRSFVDTEMIHYNSTEYKYGVCVNEGIKTISSGLIDMPFDVLIYKGGSIGSATNNVPWNLATPNVGIFYSYVGITEFTDNLIMAFAIHGYKTGEGTMYDLIYGIQQYMLQMYSNEGVPLTDEQKENLALGQPLYANLMNLEEDSSQPIAWGAMILPAASTTFNGLSQTQMFNDYTIKPFYMSHFENDTKLYPFASTSKLLTCLITVESCIDLTKLHKVIDSDILHGSGTVLKPGMMINCRDLMRLALWYSDNDACQMLARIIGHELDNDYFASRIIPSGMD